MKKAIEESFPIVEINRLAVPERNAFKPIYQMHKWFARRASCVFRAILLASMKPAGTNIMEEFYKDHTNDPDTNGVKILDPFMGGGTTVVEALRLGCHVTGIDLNPVAWFIVKTEVEPVDIDRLRDAFKRLEERKTHTGKSVKEELLSHYKTGCPCCGASSDIPLNKGGSRGLSFCNNNKEDADIIYTFWVKSAICTNPNCKREVTLFSNYIIAQKTPTIRYVPDYECTHCKKVFDMDIESASLIAEKMLTVYNPKDAAGVLRSHKRWALWDSMTHRAACPWCSYENVEAEIKSLKKAKKKVPLAVLLCPHCYAVWQYRGTLPEEVSCPACKKDYSPNRGNVPEKGSFVCPSCGTKDKIINSIRKLPQEQLLPTSPYAIEGYCPECAGETFRKNLFHEVTKSRRLTHSCMINKNNGKFFKRINPSDLKRYQDAEKRWEKERDALPYPKSVIPDGQETHRLLEHHYRYWHQMFNPRQLLCLSTLLKAIGEEEDQVMKEMLLSGFLSTLESNNVFCRYTISGGNKSQGIFSRHDFQPKISFTENNPWGSCYGHSTFRNNFEKLTEGKNFCYKPYDRKYSENKIISENRNEIIEANNDSKMFCGNSRNTIEGKFNFVITDPPYAGNVNYSELADFFYVWLRLLLSKTYPHFSPELTPKVEEIVENPTRGKTAKDYEEGLTNVWKKCHEYLEAQGLVVFTFHHAEGGAWESLLESVCNAGFLIESVYPIHGESESSLHLMDKQAISYDLIHVCKKRNRVANTKKRSWAGVRQEIRAKAREEIAMIEAGRYGSEKLLPADINIILIGKCLELYSKHYGAIVDHNGDIVPLQKALVSIRMMVEQLIDTAHPLPSELEHIDPVSYVYFTCLCDRKEIQSDEVHKATRGILEIDGLIKAGVMRKGRAKRGRTYEVKQPDERYKDLQVFFKKDTKNFHQLKLLPEMEEERFDNVALVDIIHYLMGLANASENLMLWLNEFKQAIPQVRVALEYLKKRNPTFQIPIQKIVSLIEV
ncbi:MAG: hypothetical protein B6D35_06810 [Candidatus Brocadia sp. UTAMX2]|jgi:adenine-specific DNA methylase|nr:MAG: hypothetical protein B6D35_06810 [Candidatus Brocadia sp. UTAMX2]